MTVNANISPSPFDVDLSGNIGIAVTSLPRITIDPFHFGIDPITLNPITLNPITLKLDPIDVTVRLKEFPSIRGHLPANFTLGLSILGFQLLAIRLCGEAQIITEPYRPNECERCDERTRTPYIDVPE